MFRLSGIRGFGPRGLIRGESCAVENFRMLTGVIRALYSKRSHVQYR